MSILLGVVTAAGTYADLPTLLLAVCACLLTYLYLQRPRNLPPGPRGWPLVGNLPTMAKSDFLPATFTELSKQYGDVMTIWAGRDTNIVLSGYETIRTALVKRAEDFSSRRLPPGIADIRGDATTKDTETAKGVLFAAYGPEWKHQRKFALMTLRDFGVGKRSLEGKISEEANALVQEILSQNGQPFDLKVIAQNGVSNIICSIVFGHRFEYGDPDFLRLMSLLNTVVEARPSVGDRLIMIHPVFRHLPLGNGRFAGKRSKGVEMLLTFQEFCKEQIENHRQTFDPNDIRDFIDAFLLEQQRPQDEKARENFTDKQLQEVLIDLFTAGTETTATTIRWALLYMMVNPEIQEKVHQEIDSVLGQSPPSYAQRNLLPYTAATIAEVQRIKPIVPLSVPHAASSDTTLNGYNIPQEARIMVNLWSVHMDPELFPEPGSFRPERFLDQDGNFAKHEALIPFSIGHRICLGEQLAKMELFMLFVSLMQRFTFHLPEGAPKPSMVGKLGGIINVPFPFELCAVPRG
ncbi:PREDICTED: cytochrome P450 2U1-like [Branchiostoma belcheri]|uniref:Cytochrome P450 2U1 n=1 Tax=Branchiostoma belcheri TaxID=7741 RepID=A0A6P5AKV0_BRABE|nr:PREDICTED: cytochrome P450 2U1-like [Branchiostoma belcheri]